jgi:redox-sensing transcriptional repressor
MRAATISTAFTSRKSNSAATQISARQPDCVAAAQRPQRGESQIVRRVLGTTSLQPVVLVGVGNLGLALLSYRGFEKEGFEIIAAFDINAARHRGKTTSVAIHPMDKLAPLVQERNVKMAILTVPASAAQEVANGLVQCGITGILNFAPLVLDVPETVVVNNVNLAIELENLSYFVQR